MHLIAIFWCMLVLCVFEVICKIVVFFAAVFCFMGVYWLCLSLL